MRFLNLFRKSPELRASDALRLAALAPPAALSEQPLSEQRFVVVDLETSGLNTLKDKILSVGAVTIEHSAIALGQQLLFIVLWSFLFFGASSIFASIMRASGTVTVPMLINIFAILAIEVPCAYLFSQWWGLQGIWYAYALAFVSLCILQGLYYQFVWKKKTIKTLI